MTQSFSVAKQTLLDALADETHSVIALTGKWGTGKSYLWKDVAQQIQEKSDRASTAFAEKIGKETPPIYVSLFGVRSVNELKLRIVQAAAIKGGARYKEFASGTGSLIKGLLGKFLPGSTIDDIVVMSVPTLTARRLVVIDDVERKHASLDIDEVMGFLSEYTESHKSRFLLLLNSDKLSDHEMWETLHEKVVDLEIVLAPSAAESFSTAVLDTSPAYSQTLRNSIEILGITNIRVIRRINKVIKALLATQATLDESVLARMVPSTALLTAMHFRAIPNGPTMEYVTSFNSIANLMRKKEERSQEELNWDNLLGRLGINGADEYEILVHSYLTTGVLDKSRLNSIVKRYQEESAGQSIRHRYREFCTAYFWDASLDNAALLTLAADFLADVEHFDAPTISGLVELVEDIDGVDLAATLLTKWIESMKKSAIASELEEDTWETFHQKIHPKILATLRQIKEQKFPLLSLEETMKRIGKNSGWGDRERSALLQSTVLQYENALRSLRNDALARFLSEHFSLLRTVGIQDDEPFSNALANFKNACRVICLSEPSSRLAMMLKRSFKSNGLEKDLL